MNVPAQFYALSLVIACTTAFLALPVCNRLCSRLGLVDDPGDRKVHHRPVPLAGGLTVAIALLVSVLFVVLAGGMLQNTAGGENSSSSSLYHSFVLLTKGLEKRGTQVAALALGALGMFGLGLLDDKRELRPAQKFLGQLLVSLLVAACGVRITLFVPSAIFSYIVTILWILTVVNAFNFMDNMDGLCAGLGIVAAAYVFVICHQAGQYLVALSACLICGALLGFLPHNFPRAKAFLGDSGSHLVGFLMAVLAILPHFYTRTHPRTAAVLSPLFILAVPLGDLLWVVVIRLRNRKPFYVGDTNHFSHRLVRLGLSPRQAVALIWALAAIAGGVSLALE